MLILEGGAAVQNALKKAGINAEYKRVTYDDLVEVFNGINNLISKLKAAQLIDPQKDPQFNLGSTSLAFRLFKKKMKQEVDNIDSDVLKRAELKRIESGFGDIDIDITLPKDKDAKQTMDQIELKVKEVFNKGKEYPVVTYREPSEKMLDISVGIPIGTGPCFYIQLDFMPVQNEAERNALRYWKGSSPIDEGEGIKGLFHTALGSALSKMIEPKDFIVKAAPLLGKTPEIYEEEIKEKLKIGAEKINKETGVKKGIYTLWNGKEWKCDGKKGDKVVLVSEDGKEKAVISGTEVTPLSDPDYPKALVVFSTTKDALILRGYTKIKGQKGSKEMEDPPIQDTPIPQFSLSEPNSLAQILVGPGAKEEELLSSIKLAEYIKKNWDTEKIEKFWEIFRKADRTFRNMETPEKAGSCTKDEYKHGMLTLGEKMGAKAILGDKFEIFPEEYLLEHPEERLGVAPEATDTKLTEDLHNELAYFEEESIRKGIDKSSSEQFLDILKTLYPYVKEDGIFHANASPNIDLVEKVDSSFCHFGQDEDGKFFLASSNSGDATEDNFEEIFNHNIDFTESFRFLKDHKLLQVVLQHIIKEIDKPVKFEAEILPVLTHQPDENGNIVFNATKYSKDKLGEKGAFVVFKAQIFENGEWKKPSASTQKKLISDILDADSGVWKIFSNDVHMKVSKDINFGVDFKELDNYLGTESGFEKLELLLGKGSKTTPEKTRVKNIIKLFKEKIEGTEEVPSILSQIADTLPSNLGNDYMEGLILRIKNDDGNVTEIKGLTKQFQDNKAKLWEFRDKFGKFGELYQSLDKEIKTNILQLGLTTERSISDVFATVAGDFKPTRGTKEEVKDEFLTQVLNTAQKSKPDFSNIKKTGKSLVNKYKKALGDVKREWKEKKETFDVNSLRKTEQNVNNYEEKFNRVFEALLTETTNDWDYAINCLNAIYSGRAKNLLIHLEPAAKQIQTKKCALWVGRAQPWHKGHDQMVKIGLENAEVVCIVIIKGAKSSEDKEKNPLSAELQKELIRSLYPSDKVIVCDQHPKSVDLNDIMSILYQQGLEATVWLQGEDREDAYVGLFGYFNFEKWTKTHDYIPIKPSVKFIVTPRVTSATDARKAAKTVPFIEWVKEFAPKGISNAAVGAYKKIYTEIRGPEEEIIHETIRKMFKESLAPNDDEQGTLSIPVDAMTDIINKDKEDNLFQQNDNPPEGSQKKVDVIKIDPEPSESNINSTKDVERNKNELNKIFREIFKELYSNQKQEAKDEATVKEFLSKFNDELFAPEFSKGLKEAIKLILETIGIVIIEHNPDEKKVELTQQEELFLEQYFSEIIAPLALKYPELILNKEKYKEISEALKYDWNGTVKIKYPLDSAQELFDSIIFSDLKHIKISCKSDKGGAAASINTLYSAFNEMKKLDPKLINPLYTKKHTISNNSFSAYDVMQVLLKGADNTQLLVPLTEGKVIKLKSSETLWCYSALDLASLSILGFTNSIKLQLYSLFDENRKAMGLGRNIIFEKNRERMRILLATLTDKKLVSKLMESLDEKNDSYGYMYGVIGHLAQSAANNINDSSLGEPISDLIKELLSNSSVMQINGSYSDKKLKFKLIHPLTIPPGSFIKLDGGHNYFRRSSSTKNYGNRTTPAGGIAFVFPK